MSDKPLQRVTNCVADIGHMLRHVIPFPLFATTSRRKTNHRPTHALKQPEGPSAPIQPVCRGSESAIEK